MTEQDRRRSELSHFLRARRAQISPEHLGLPLRARRRTPGLRREEVAELIGIGVTWYTWLEQGRTIMVSEEVLENLAHVLQLSEDERAHLFLLAGRPLPSHTSLPEIFVRPAWQALLTALEPYPAHIRDKRWYVLAWNKAEQLIAQWEEVPEAERHVVWNHFTNPSLRRMLRDWEGDARTLLALFRMEQGKDAEEIWLNDLTTRLQRLSPEFRQWWPLHEVRKQREQPIAILHPQVGELLLERVTLLFEANQSLSARVLLPLSGSDTAAHLCELLSQTD